MGVKNGVIFWSKNDQNFDQIFDNFFSWKSRFFRCFIKIENLRKKSGDFLKTPLVQ